MLWDFTKLKELLSEFDHSTILRRCKENERLVDELRAMKSKVVLLENEPTVENLATHLLRKLEREHPKLKFKVRVYESPMSFVEVDQKEKGIE